MRYDADRERVTALTGQGDTVFRGIQRRFRWSVNPEARRRCGSNGNQMATISAVTRVIPLGQEDQRTSEGARPPQWAFAAAGGQGAPGARGGDPHYARGTTGVGAVGAPARWTVVLGQRAIDPRGSRLAMSMATS